MPKDVNDLFEKADFFILEMGQHPLKAIISNDFYDENSKFQFDKDQIESFLKKYNKEIADPNSRTDGDNLPYIHHFAGDAVLMKCFIEKFSKKIEWNITNDEGLNVAHYAVSINRPEVLELLYKQKKLDLNALDKTGYNLLETAIKAHNPGGNRDCSEIAKQIVGYGIINVDPSKQYDQQQLALIDSLPNITREISTTKKASPEELTRERLTQVTKAFKQEFRDLNTDSSVSDEVMHGRLAQSLVINLHPGAQVEQQASAVKAITSDIPEICNLINQNDTTNRRNSISAEATRSMSIKLNRLAGGTTILEDKVQEVANKVTTVIKDRGKNLNSPTQTKTSNELPIYGATDLTPPDFDTGKYNPDIQTTRRDPLTIASQSFKNSSLESINEASNIQQQSGSTPSNNKGPQQGVII